MLHHVALVRTDISEERIAFIIRITRIGEPRMLRVASNRHAEKKYNTILYYTKLHTVIFCSVLQLLITANIVLSLPSLVILMMKAIHSSEMSVLTRATQRNVPEDGILRKVIHMI
jgi:hypothetical protein